VQYSFWYDEPNNWPIGGLVAEELLHHHTTNRQIIGRIIPQALLLEGTIY
jgi:hypothetical protein